MITADLAGRTALVTGGASGIGLATVRRLAACDARVAINDLPSNPKLADVEAQLRREGLDVITVSGSVGNPDDTTAVVEATVQRFGRLDYLVNNAGTSETATPPVLCTCELNMDANGDSAGALWNTTSLRR